MYLDVMLWLLSMWCAFFPSSFGKEMREIYNKVMEGWNSR